LLQNIKKRGREYEQNIQPEYLMDINKSYLSFIKSQTNMKVQIIDISELDFVN
ncbi:deoxynucleoside kinase, partial [Zunongwangia profunda]